MKRFAVFGSPIDHSLSPLIHYLFAKQTGIKLRYDKQLVEPKDFSTEVKYFFRSGGYGLNITSPLKELAYKISDIQTERAQKSGSANTLWYKSNQIFADNTDGPGLILDLKNYIDINSKKILIIGAGGAARGIIDAINLENPKSISILNRSKLRLSDMINDFSKRVPLIYANLKDEYDIIINTTPSAAEIIPDEVIKKSLFCYDLNYKYKNFTQFELRALKLGVTAKNGLGMLINQAAMAFTIWHDIRPNILRSSPIFTELHFPHKSA